MNQYTFTPSADAIRRHLPIALTSLPIHTYAVIDSTNAEGKRLCLPTGSSAALLIAGAQKAGRGRMDRSFYSPSGTGLYMTLVYQTNHAPAASCGLTPAVAVAAAEAIESLTGQDVCIKWVNDLYQNGRKVGGILVEAVPNGQGTRFIIGIGINLTTAHFPDGFRAPAGALSDAGEAVPSPEVLCAAVAARLFRCLADGFADGFATARPSYRAHSLLKEGQPIRIFRGVDDHAEDGVVVGIADDYALIVRLPDGQEERLSGGEVSVRGL